MNFPKNIFKLNSADEKKSARDWHRLASRDSSTTPKCRTEKRSRKDLLSQRKAMLKEIAEFTPDTIVVLACLNYLKAYFGSEGRMICELLKNSAHWQLQILQIKTETRLEWLYYRFVKGFSETEWQAKLDSEIEDFIAENEL